MRIAYVYEYDASNPGTQSGRPFSLWQELRRRFDVVEFFPIFNLSRLLLTPKKIPYALKDRSHRLEREWLSLKEYSWRAGRFLRREKVDVVFSPSQLTITYLQTSARIIYCNDAPFGAIANQYSNFTKLSETYVRQGYRQEYLSHKNADRIVYPSAWARESAIRLHHADPQKCVEQAFGANLPYRPSWNDVKEAASRRAGHSEVSLIMISSDWERKGGSFAVDVVRELKRRGMRARLTVIGAGPADGIPDVASLGWLNKWTESGAQSFRETMFDSDFIIMPSLAEAYGMALWEGAAHGLPMIGRAVGGIPSIIRHGENGILFPFEASATLVANWIEEAFDPNMYRRLSERAFNDYQTRGNWRSFVDGVFGL